MKVGGRIAFRAAVALALYLAMGLSLGWYYTFTYYGRAGWPMPQPEPCGAILLYYFSVLNVDTEYQAVHWMIVFPAAGFLWAWVLVIVGRRMGQGDVKVMDTFVALSWACLPIALLAPWMTWVGGNVDGEFTFTRMMAVALRRGGVSPWATLSPMYFGLGLIGLALQFVAYSRQFPLRGVRALSHWGASGALYVLSCVILAATLAIPMRLMFE